jgi:hypothetical protein
MVAARKDAAAALEIAATIEAAEPPSVYVDPYDDGHETDRDDHCGESWKFGTIYDKRNYDE